MCGKAISGSDILYTEDAREVCATCSAQASIQGDERRAARNIQVAAWTCLGISLASWLFDPYFVCNITAILSGVYALKSMGRGNERFTRYLTSGGRTQVWVCSIIGLVLTGIQLLVILIVVAFIASHPHPTF